MEYRYDYLEQVTADAKEAILDNLERWEPWDRYDAEERAYDELWTYDSVTGNASGSYYCNAWRAEEALCHNWDLLYEAINELGGVYDCIKQGPEAMDVTIRCYVLGEAISAALDELEAENNIVYGEDTES